MSCQEKKVKFCFYLHCETFGFLVPWPGIEPGLSAVRMQNHWTTRNSKSEIWMGWSITKMRYNASEMMFEQRLQGSEEDSSAVSSGGVSWVAEEGAGGVFLVDLKTWNAVLPFLQCEVLGQWVLCEGRHLKSNGIIFFLSISILSSSCNHSWDDET